MLPNALQQVAAWARIVSFGKKGSIAQACNAPIDEDARSDLAGAFLVSGFYVVKSGFLWMRKKYPLHTVLYRGHTSQEPRFRGEWCILPRQSGTWQMWPVTDDSHEGEREHSEVVVTEFATNESEVCV